MSLFLPLIAVMRRAAGLFIPLLFSFRTIPLLGIHSSPSNCGDVNSFPLDVGSRGVFLHFPCEKGTAIPFP